MPFFILFSDNLMKNRFLILLFIFATIFGCEEPNSASSLAGDWQIIARYSLNGDSFVSWDKSIPDPVLSFRENGDFVALDSNRQKKYWSGWSLDEQHQQLQIKSAIKGNDTSSSTYQISNWRNKTMEIRSLRYGNRDMMILLQKLKH